MTSDIPREQLAATLDQVVDELLWAAEIDAPPVNAFRVAAGLGITVGRRAEQPHRGEYLRLATSAGPSSRGTAGQAEPLMPAVFLRPEVRPEREQWALAHELGEHVAGDVAGRLGIDPVDLPPLSREQLANVVACRLLLPSRWFWSYEATLAGDLLALKRTFSTASHELIARRWLDARRPCVVSIVDQGKLNWRRSAGGGRSPPRGELELHAWQTSHATGQPCRRSTPVLLVRVWPLHEPRWRREIVRLDLLAEHDGCDPIGSAEG